MTALALIYGFVVKSRTLLYERGWLSRSRLPCTVLSVGNLTVGGTGKTPIVILLAQWLLARGRRVAILSRGYRRNSRIPRLLISDGQNILTGPQESGDEPFLIARRCPGAVVAVGPDRYGLGQWVLERIAVDYVLLDDGFQHLALQRDVDLLLIDTSDSAGLCQLLPSGRLREPLSAATRATALVLTRVDEKTNVHEILHPIEAAIGQKVQPILTRFQVRSLMHVSTGNTHDSNWLKGKRVLIFSGIGNTGSFRDTVSDLDARILDELVFPDHYAYTDQDLHAVRDRMQNCGAELILTTEKDAVKIESLLTPHDPMWAIRFDVEMISAELRPELCRYRRRARTLGTAYPWRKTACPYIETPFNASWFGGRIGSAMRSCAYPP